VEFLRRNVSPNGQVKKGFSNRILGKNLTRNLEPIINLNLKLFQMVPRIIPTENEVNNF